MDLVVFRSNELDAVLGALRNVALADGAVTHEERAVVEGLARLHGRNVSFDDVAPCTPAQVASVVVAPHQRKRCVQLAIVAALAAGPPSIARETAVNDLAKALGNDDVGVAVLHDMTHGHMMFARFDVARRMRKFMTGHDKVPHLADLVRFAGIGEDKALTAKYEALQDYPRESFGHAVYAHYREHGFALPGEAHGIPERMMFHDFGHVLSGYGVDPAGEIQQAAFQAGFVRNDGFLFLMFGILQFHIGIQLTPIAKPEHGFFDVDKVMRAAARGAACKVDLSDPEFDFWKYARAPLAELRRELGVS